MEDRNTQKKSGMVHNWISGSKMEWYNNMPGIYISTKFSLLRIISTVVKV